MDIIIEEEEDINQGNLQRAKDDFQENSSYSKEIFCAWAIVKKTYSSRGMVDVELSTGNIIKNCGVVSKEWAGFDTDGGYGERNLPPENSKVLILFPEGIIENAVILGSKLSLLGKVGEEQKAEGLFDADKESEKLKISKGGLKEIYDSSTGNWSLEDKNGNKIEWSSTGIKITDKDNNIYETATNGIKITDQSGNVIESGTDSLVINSNLEILQ